MAPIKFPFTKYLTLLLLALTLFVTALFPIHLERRYLSLVFHPVDGDGTAVHYRTPTSYSVVVTTSTVTASYECSQTTPKKEKSSYNRLRVQEEQMRRRSHLQETCISEAGDSRLKTELNRKHFLVDRNRQILYCWIHKVASTSWISFFARLRGLRVRTRWIYREISRLSASSSEEVRLAESDYRIRLLVVRHPFRRLISAYRDRIWAATHKYSAQALTHVPRIFRLTRPNLYQFKSSLSIIKNNSRTLAIVPTFEEFVRYLLVASNTNFNNETHQNKSSKTAFDVHWAPYHEHCSVCSVPFNIIIKLETIEEDTTYLMEELGLEPYQVKGAESMMDEKHNEFHVENERSKLAAPLKNKSSIKDSFSNIQLKGRDTTSQNLYKITSNETVKKLQSTHKQGDSLETEDQQMITSNLDHFQVSNIGPSCPCYYFSQLTSEQIHGLTKIYEKDLKIFGYSTEEYINCLTHTL